MRRRPTVAAMQLLAKVLRRVLPFVSLLTLFIATKIAVKSLCRAMSGNFSNVFSAPVSFVSGRQTIVPWSTSSTTWCVSPRSSAEPSTDEPVDLHGTSLQECSRKDVRSCFARIVSVWPSTGKRNTHHGNRENVDDAFQRSQTRASPQLVMARSISCRIVQL